MIKFKNFIVINLFLVIVLVSTKSFSDNHNVMEILELIQKDIKTLEKAVYASSSDDNFNSSTSSSYIDQNTEDVLTRHLLKLSEIENQFQELTNKSILTTASRDTLRSQAAWMRKNSDISVTIQGHADERGTREYNLALGERRANAAKDYLMTYGVAGNRLSVISYGKERPVDSGSNPLAWSKNRRSVTVKAN